MEAIMGRAATYAKLEDLQGAVKSYLDTRGPAHAGARR
jgi:hypothetical protein